MRGALALVWRMLLDLVQLDTLQRFCGVGDPQMQWQDDHLWFHVYLMEMKGRLDTWLSSWSGHCQTSCPIASIEG